MGQYSLVENNAHLKDENGRIHYVDAREARQWILYALARKYPYYGTVVIERGTDWDDDIKELAKYGVFLDTVLVSGEFNFEARMVILPFEALGSDHKDLEGLHRALMEYYKTLCENQIPDEELAKKSPEFLYLDGLEEYKLYREVRKLLEKEEIWKKTRLAFVDLEEYRKQQEEVLQEKLKESIDFYLKTLKPEEIYQVGRDDPLIKYWMNTSGEMAEAKFHTLLELYEQIISMPQTHFYFLFLDKIDTMVFAAFAAAFITHGKKLLVHISSQSRIYEQYILQFSRLDFGTIEQRLYRLQTLGNLSAGPDVYTLRTCITASGNPSLGLLKNTYIDLKFKVVDMETLTGLVGKKDGKYIYRVDPDDFDSCGKIYTEEDFDFGEVDEEGDPKYSLQPVTKALGIPKILDGKQKPGSDYVEYMYRVLRLIDQYVCTYTHFTTLRDAIVVQGPNKSYIGVGSLESKFEGDLLSLGKDESYIIEDMELPAEMYDVRLIFNWSKEYLSRLQKAYASKYDGKDLAGFKLSYGTLPKLNRDEIYMCLYWACQHEIGNLNKKVDLDWTQLMMANTFNYWVSKYLFPVMFETLKVFKPYGFREFSADKSPLNIFGGFNYRYDKRAMLFVQVYQEAFKAFPGSVRRLDDGSGLSD